MLRGVYVGHHERSGAATFRKPDGAKRGTRIAIMLEHESWDRVFSEACIGVPWQLRPEKWNLARLVVLVAEADQGVAPVIVIPTSVKQARSGQQACTTRRFLTTTDAEIAEARRGKEKMLKNWQRVRRNNISTLMLRCGPTKLTG